MRKGDLLTLTCDALDGEGAAIARHGEARIHVAGALPGERVRARVTHRSPHRPEAWAELLGFDARAPERSPDRVAPACRAYGRCGGCALEHFAYEAQWRWKVEATRAALAGASGLATLPVGPGAASPAPLGYRNRAKLVYGLVGGRPRLGAYAPRSHDLVDLEGCRVTEPAVERAVEALRAALAERPPAPYDERTGDGTLRYAVVRANALGEVLIVLVTRGAEFPEGEALARTLIGGSVGVIGVVQHVNPTRGNAIFGGASGRDLPLAGRVLLEEAVGPVRLRLSPTSFFQANRAVAARLYDDARAAAALASGERLVDCYAGVGGVGLTLAVGVGGAELVGIEENPAAVADAEASAALSGVAGARFVAGDAAGALAGIARADVVVLNPPRRGCDEAVLAEVLRLGPRRILYVSCAPETLARDLGWLAGRGLTARAVTLYDMLPQTPHVEALAVIDGPRPGA